MAKETTMTAEEYVVARLIKLEEENTKLIKMNKCLQEDLNDFQEDFLKIKKHFKVELSTGKTELKLMFYENPNSVYSCGSLIVFSGSLDPKSFKSDFKLYIQLLSLTEDVEKVLEELNNEDGKGSTENK